MTILPPEYSHNVLVGLNRIVIVQLVDSPPYKYDSTITEETGCPTYATNLKQRYQRPKTRHMHRTILQ